MTKVTTKITTLTRKLTLLKLSGFSKKHQVAAPLATEKVDKHHEDNGERWLHVMPEIGESYLGTSLYQLELERAKAIAVA